MSSRGKGKLRLSKGIQNSDNCDSSRNVLEHERPQTRQKNFVEDEASNTKWKTKRRKYLDTDIKDGRSQKQRKPVDGNDDNELPKIDSRNTHTSSRVAIESVIADLPSLDDDSEFAIEGEFTQAPSVSSVDDIDKI